MANTVLQVNLGGHLAELSPIEVEGLVSSGVLRLPEGYKSGLRFGVIASHYDVYMCQAMHQYPLQELIQVRSKCTILFLTNKSHSLYLPLFVKMLQTTLVSLVNMHAPSC